MRRHVEWTELVHALSGLFSVDAHDIGLLDIDDVNQLKFPVLVQCIERESGFRMDLTFYIAASVSPLPSGVELARGLAQALGQEVLTSPPDSPGTGMSSPASWILALPQGELRAVRQINLESEAVEIDWRPERTP